MNARIPWTPVVCWVIPSAYRIDPGRFFAIVSAISLICAAGMPVMRSPVSSVYRETKVFSRAKTQCGSLRLAATFGLPLPSSWYPQLDESYLCFASSYPLKRPSWKSNALSPRKRAFVWVTT